MARPSYTYYPGCTAKTSSKEFEISTLMVCEKLGIDLVELEDWNCCGASSAHTVSTLVGLALPARDLQVAERMGKPVVTGCAMCWHRLKYAVHDLSDKNKLAEVNEVLGKEFRNTVKVEHFLQIFAAHSDLLTPRLALKGLKVASYYGCVLVRPKAVMAMDDEDNPQLMDNIIRQLGAEAVEWDLKTACCGASLPLAHPEAVVKLSRQVLKQARASGANCVAVACPMCHSNLDVRQKAIKSAYPDFEGMPIYYFTQLMGLALGFSPEEMHIDKHLTDGLDLLREKGLN